MKFWILLIDSVNGILTDSIANKEIAYTCKDASNIETGDAILGYITAPIGKVRMVFNASNPPSDTTLFLEKTLDVAPGCDVPETLYKDILSYLSTDKKCVEITENEYNALVQNLICSFDKTIKVTPINKVDVGENVILYGVPGCGKSHTIKDEYCNDKRYMERVVFHPDYTYSDFIGQILPVISKSNGEESISYKFTAGPFTKILKDAVDDKEGKMHYLVIEEINRGNAPAIFGEVFQLLDRENGESEYGITNFDIADYVYGDKEHEIKIPANLTILATMNTADQNVFTLDTAFKRRWVMRSIKNDIAACEHADECIAGTNVTWYSFAKKINDTIIDISDGNLSSEDNRLGAYFVKSDDLKSRKTFGEKVLMYLWNDAFKYDRDVIFNSEYKTLEDLLDAFEDYGFAVFNSVLEFDTVVTETAEGSSKYEGDPQEYLSTKKPEFVAIYETLVELLESKISTTIDKYTTRTNDHISLRTQGKVLAEVHIQKAKIKVLTRVPNNTEYLIGTKVPDTHNWTLNYSIDFSDDSNIETVVNAIIDSQNLA